MDVLLVMIFYPLFIVFMVYIGKWVLAGITILTGDKESLKDFGNLCGKEELPKNYWGNNHWKDNDWRNRGEGNMF